MIRRVRTNTDFFLDKVLERILQISCEKKFFSFGIIDIQSDDERSQPMSVRAERFRVYLGPIC